MIDGWQLPSLALITGACATLVWFVVVLRVLEAIARRKEHRTTYIGLIIMGLLVALGTLASALGSAMVRGEIVLDIDRDTISLIASMGRGALLMAGVIVLTTYHPSYKAKP